VLVLVPTRELALQVLEQGQALSRKIDVRIAAIYGGVKYGKQDEALKRGVDIVVATPGRLLDHVERRMIRFGALQTLVLDEADRMLDVGFLPAIRQIVRLLPRKRQTLLFSATLQPIMQLASEVTQDAVRIEVEKAPAPHLITQTLFPVPEHVKFQLLEKLLQDQAMESVLIFTRTKHRADRLARNLKRANTAARVIHSNRSQSQRIAALDAFKRGHTRVLVATDIAARGIDVEGVSHVVNYDVPTIPEDYVHRIGRTGRAEVEGEAYTFVTPQDERMIARIEAVLKRKVQRRKVDGIDYNTPVLVKPDTEAIRRYVEANRRRDLEPRRARAH
jgi:ATP-dependent RNA helicase RhlE